VPTTVSARQMWRTYAMDVALGSTSHHNPAR
jgi:hypothetical protein